MAPGFFARLFGKKRSTTIVIVCTANITRSPYFAAYLKRLIREKPIPLIDNVSVISAGVAAQPRIAANPIMVMVAKMQGLAIHDHRSRRFSTAIASEADLVLTMEKAQKETLLERFPELEGKVFTVLEYGRPEGSVAEPDVDDPTGREVEDFRGFIEIAHKEAERIYTQLRIHGLPKPA